MVDPTGDYLPMEQDKNGASPIIWAAISTVLCLALKEKIYGGIFRSPFTGLLTSLADFVFVDNTGLLQTQDNDKENVGYIVDELQGSLDLW